jgi:hypothetical protein
MGGECELGAAEPLNSEPANSAGCRKSSGAAPMELELELRLRALELRLGTAKSALSAQGHAAIASSTRGHESKKGKTNT